MPQKGKHSYKHFNKELRNQLSSFWNDEKRSVRWIGIQLEFMRPTIKAELQRGFANAYDTDGREIYDPELAELTYIKANRERVRKMTVTKALKRQEKKEQEEQG